MNLVQTQKLEPIKLTELREQICKSLGDPDLKKETFLYYCDKALDFIENIQTRFEDNSSDNNTFLIDFYKDLKNEWRNITFYNSPYSEIKVDTGQDVFDAVSTSIDGLNTYSTMPNTLENSLNETHIKALADIITSAKTIDQKQYAYETLGLIATFASCRIKQEQDDMITTISNIIPEGVIITPPAFQKEKENIAQSADDLIKQDLEKLQFNLIKNGFTTNPDLAKIAAEVILEDYPEKPKLGTTFAEAFPEIAKRLSKTPELETIFFDTLKTEVADIYAEIFKYVYDKRVNVGSSLKKHVVIFPAIKSKKTECLILVMLTDSKLRLYTSEDNKKIALQLAANNPYKIVALLAILSCAPDTPVIDRLKNFLPNPVSTFNILSKHLSLNFINYSNPTCGEVAAKIKDKMLTSKR